MTMLVEEFEKALFKSAMDDLDELFKYNEVPILLGKYIVDKKLIKDIKNKYLLSKDLSKVKRLKNEISDKFGLTFENAVQLDQNDLRLLIKISNIDKFKSVICA